MRHPFDGIIVPRQLNEQPSRREALVIIASASAASLVGTVAQAEGPTDIAIKKDGALASPPAGVAKDQKYHLYYVVPKEVRLFDARRRMDLNIRGELLPGLALHKDLGDKQGFLGWLDKAEAEKAKAAEDVALVHEMTPSDVMVQGTAPAKGVATLRVFAAPLGWRNPPAADTYLNLKQLGDLWTSQLAMKDGVTVIANDKVRQPFIQFKEGKVADDVLATIKSQPQVYAVQWLTPAAESTRALREEGGGVVTTDALREEAATTLALGEEGGVPSTRALGEEGGVTTERADEEGGGITTFAVGEEGGSTERLGEEGGVSTRGRGEEGGASTRALGEEGGGISTEALGEEGGGVSTKAIGEEGGVRPMPQIKPDIPAIE
jgi:hypothetical protein